jgi:glycogen synthase
MRVFMLGWEFPPFISGGLGTACYGLTKALSAAGTDVVFVLPKPLNAPYSSHVRVVAPSTSTSTSTSWSSSSQEQTYHHLDEFEHVTFHTLDAKGGSPYASPGDASPQVSKFKSVTGSTSTSTHTDTTTTTTTTTTEHTHDTQSSTTTSSPGAHYTGDLFTEVQRYAKLACELAKDESFDLVHAHDWMTYPAGLAVAAAKGKPLVVHVHSTEFDRSGQNIDQRIYDIERRGMHAAIKVVAVSHLTKNLITHHYGVDPSKIEVVYNAIETNGNGLGFDPEKYAIKRGEKIVLFLGRITMQKGPEYFISAAKKVLEVMPDVKFIMAGSGDMTRKTIEMAAEMGIGHKVLFTGFLRGKDVEDVFKMADVYVMPSVSEPFGIAPLEAIANDVPVIISKQSGVSEVIQNALKVDFWDTHEMANKIVAVLKHPPLRNTLREHGAMEVKKLSWADSAAACDRIYGQAIKVMAKA